MKRYCKECKGSGICEHNKMKIHCADCGGNRICKASKDPYNNGCRTSGNHKYNGFCVFCYIHIHPDDPKSLTAKNKSKELQTIIYLCNKYEGFIYNKPFYIDLEGGCCETKRRIDLRKLINNTMLCIEIDEDQHKRYIKNDDNIRYNELLMDFTGKYIFIRYNPDKYKDKYNKSKNPFLKNRMDALENIINKQINRIENNENEELLEIHHLFYDEI